MRRLLALHAWAAIAFLWLPMVAVALLSFSESRYGLRLEGFTLRWYANLAADARLAEYLRNTLVVALASTALATALGTFLALALARQRFRLRAALEGLLYLPLVVPDVVLGIALLILFTLLREWLGGPQLSLLTVTLGHTAFQLSYVTLVVRARLSLLDPALEEAARDLGATPWQAFAHVTLPLLAPGIGAGALLALSLSLDDFVITFFTAGSGSTTLPLYLYSSLKLGIRPEIHALSTLLMGSTILALLIGYLHARKRP